jgi:hypothetical protein
MENKTTTVVITLVLLLLVVAMFGYSYIKKQQTKEMPNEPLTEVPAENDPYSHITNVNAKHFYIDGVHTLVGQIVMPTPCDLLESSSLVAESYPEQVSINFDVINNAENCVQVETPQNFKVTATASGEATFHAHLNGRHVELNLIPAAEGETPEEFELYIKG